MERTDRSRRRVPLATLSLAAAAVVWGSTFVLMKRSLEQITPLWFMSWRFMLALAITGPVALLQRRGSRGGELKRGVVLAVLLYFVYILQILGIERTTAGNAALITGLFVIIVPLTAIFIMKRIPEARAVLGALVSFAGLGLLTIQPGWGLRAGDMLIFGSAVCLAFYIIALDLYAPVSDIGVLMGVQGCVLAAALVLTALAAEPAVVPGHGFVWMSLVVCGVLGSAVAFYLQAFAQRRIEPERVAVILMLEPVVGVALGIFVLAEKFQPRGWFGAALILGGIAITEVRTRLVAR
ncbi:MAG: DMT family transporter [Candidatus Geothermincolia bacterium]